MCIANSSVFRVEPDGDIPHIPTSNISDEMEVLVIREEIVKEILSGLNSDKSRRPDGIHPRLSDILCIPLTKLFNKFLSVCKSMEHCVRNHIENHMMVNNLFSSRQYGFVKGRSTV